ncbi:MAG: hypothetical protein GC136_07870 [Alphaproteobacteria bacterium]|nr:hypothetical protein [Alphaproteobacteria bacterium]
MRKLWSEITASAALGATAMVALIMVPALLISAFSGAHNANASSPEPGGFTVLDDGDCIQGADAQRDFSVCQNGTVTTHFARGALGFERDTEMVINTRTNTVTLREFDERGRIAHTEANTLRAQNSRIYFQGLMSESRDVFDNALNPAVRDVAENAVLGFAPSPALTPYIS